MIITEDQRKGEQMDKIRAGIIGSTGYAGAELARILLGHPGAEIVWYGSRSYTDQAYAGIYQNMFRLVNAVCLDDNIDNFHPGFVFSGELTGKKVVLFGSYGWGDGELMRLWEDEAKAAGAELAAESLMINGAPDDDGEADCKALGAALA